MCCFFFIIGLEIKIQIITFIIIYYRRRTVININDVFLFYYNPKIRIKDSFSLLNSSNIFDENEL
jgi:hypothetical protein